jgi:AraC family transcriptional regulator
MNVGIQSMPGRNPLLGDAWARFMGEWLPQSGHRVGPRPAYEAYRNNPVNAKPEELCTELYLSIA